MSQEKISFAEEVKNELALYAFDDEEKFCEKCCRAELAAIFRYGLIQANEEQTCYTFATEHSYVARKIFVYLKKFHLDFVRAEISIRRFRKFLNTHIKRNMVLLRFFPRNHQEKKNFQDFFALLLEKNLHKTNLLRKSCCRRAFLRGAFLMAGHVNRPFKSMRLEYSMHTQEDAHEILSVLKKFSFPARCVERRKNNFVVYLRDTDSILDLLFLLQANNSANQLEAASNLKDIRNQVNRVVNCETHNLKQAIRAANDDILEIQKILADDTKKILLEQNQKLWQTAQARLNHPEASLTELGAILNASKMAVYQRLKKIKNL